MRFIQYINNLDTVSLEAINARDTTIEEPGPCAAVRLDSENTLKPLRGASKNNIVNLNSRKEGLQLEFHLNLLEGIATESKTTKYQNYEKAILDAAGYAIAE